MLSNVYKWLFGNKSTMQLLEERIATLETQVAELIQNQQDRRSLVDTVINIDDTVECNYFEPIPQCNIQVNNLEKQEQVCHYPIIFYDAWKPCHDTGDGLTM